MNEPAFYTEDDRVDRKRFVFLKNIYYKIFFTL